MDTNQIWAQALSISKNDFKQWLSQAPNNASLVHYCIQQGFINAEAYLNWAMEFYKLPVIRSDYFQNQSHVEKIKALNSNNKQSSTLLYIEQWDGITYVACADPTSAGSFDFQYQLILANPLDIKFFTSNSTQPSIEESFQPEQTVKPMESIELSKEAQPVESIEPSKEAKPVESIELSQEAQPVESIELSQEVQPVASIEPSEEVQQKEEAPDGLDLSEVDLNVNDEVKISNSTDPFEDLLDGVSEVTEDSKKTSPLDDIDFSESVTSTNESTPPSLKLEENSASEDLVEITEKNVTSKTNTTIHFDFSAIENVYPTAMILKLENNEFYPLHLNNQWNTHGECKVETQSDSFFKVVFNTNKPYHGPFINNKTHQKFFSTYKPKSEFNFVTLSPIINQGQLWGALLCVDKNDEFDLHKLIKIEKIINNFSPSLFTQKSNAA